MTKKILIIDDEESLRLFLSGTLAKAGYKTTTACNADEALAILEKTYFPLVITDLKMPGKDGIELLKKIKILFPETEVIIITAFGSIETAVDAMKAGAVDFLVKPLPNPQYIRTIVEKTFVHIQAQQNKLYIESIAFQPVLITEDEQSKAVYKLLQLVAPSPATVLLTGETGTGKEIAARTIHALSSRSKKPFIAINCASLPENLLESELFGFEKGAFTGATQNKAGKFVLADTGTIFLDEIGELSLALQAKLLRVIQEKELEPLGSVRTRSIDIRFIAATNKNLEKEILSGSFRQDLYYRLNVFPIELPPLRKRKKDILPLVNHFLGGNANQLSPQAKESLLTYNYPGNIRELQNILERALILSQGKTILPQHLRLSQQDGTDSNSMEDAERTAIEKALSTVKGHRVKAASLLGISLRTLQYKIKKYNVANNMQNLHS